MHSTVETEAMTMKFSLSKYMSKTLKTQLNHKTMTNQLNQKMKNMPTYHKKSTDLWELRLVNKQMAARNAKGRLHFQETGFHREVKARPFPSESSAKNVIVVLCKHSFFGSESFHHYSGPSTSRATCMWHYVLSKDDSRAHSNVSLACSNKFAESEPWNIAKRWVGPEEQKRETEETNR